MTDVADLGTHHPCTSADNGTKRYSVGSSSAPYGLVVKFNAQCQLGEYDDLTISGYGYLDSSDELANRTFYLPGVSAVELAFYHDDDSGSSLYGYQVESVRPMLQYELGACDIYCSSSVPYTGKARTPSLGIYDSMNEESLQKGTDYSVTYSNNTNVGTATATITGLGNYAGQVVYKTFQIYDNHDLTNASISTYGYFDSATPYMPDFYVSLDYNDVPESCYRVSLLERRSDETGSYTAVNRVRIV